MDASHTNLLHDGIFVDQSQPSATASFSSLAVIDHLQSALRHEQERRAEMEKELAVYKKRVRELETVMATKDERLTRGSELHQAQLQSIRARVRQSLKYATATKSQSFLKPEGSVKPKQIEFDHRCDECTFHSKSDVSLILHKINHSLVEQQHVLSATSFTTRNQNSKNIYTCPACNSADKMTRHEVYRHIYDVHTTEKPLACLYCEYSFTHKDYLEDHVRTKHAKLANYNKGSTVPTLRADASNLNPHLKESWTNSLIAKAATVATSSSGGGGKSSQTPVTKCAMNPGGFAANPFVTTIITPSIKSLTTTKFSASRGRPSGSKGGSELKCTFLDCNFATINQDKLDFHMKAHVNTKYKCPYCPYVSNTIIDIKRHIQKSKKHEGMKMYSCQKCGFGADCDRMFKEHLRTYHFGFEVQDHVVDYFIEEMFSNKNNKRPGPEDELTQVQLAQLQHQLQHPQLHHPPGTAEGLMSSSSSGSALKKHVNSSSANTTPSLSILMEQQSAGAHRKRTASHSQQLTTMIEEVRETPSSNAPTQQPTAAHHQVTSQQQQQQTNALDSLLLNSYRSNAVNSPILNHQAATTNQLVVNALGLNNISQPVQIMYHTLHDLATGGSDSQQQAHQTHQLSQQQHHSSQFHHSLQNLSQSMATQQQQQQQQHHAEASALQLVQQQQQQQQQVPSRPQSQQGPPSGSSVQFVSSELPANLQQYVTYANY